jgi:hypothetical protein
LFPHGLLEQTLGGREILLLECFSSALERGLRPQ